MVMRTDLSRRERQIIEVIYRLGEVSANQIVEALPDELANATVRTQLRVLEEKGAVTFRRDGKRFLYRAVMAKKSAAKSALRSVLQVFFGGSLEHLVAAHLADPKAKLSDDELRRMKEMIEKHSQDMQEKE